MPVAEITVRTEAAIDAIRLIAKHKPDMLVGAGTVLTEDQVHAVQDAGAAFALAPGIDRAVLSEARRAGLSFVLGVKTPSDIQTALRAGCRRVEFFPAAAAGALDMFKSLAAPYRHTGLRFNPTGGITPDTMNDWLNHDFVFTVGESWIASASDISEHRWDTIAAKAEAASQVAQG
ncbi:MAG: bifunctional 4-hydroxy-2-oxoglutarate aldolase/2-dehydro-3-deoxy-phosphogluconate aldolase [Aliishimia sp.]